MHVPAYAWGGARDNLPLNVTEQSVMVIVTLSVIQYSWGKSNQNRNNLCLYIYIYPPWYLILYVFQYVCIYVHTSIKLTLLKHMTTGFSTLTELWDHHPNHTLSPALPPSPWCVTLLHWPAFLVSLSPSTPKLGLGLKASCLLGKHSRTWVTPLALSALVISLIGFHASAQLVLLHKWNPKRCPFYLF
jgi:hypothetical protein